MPAPGLGIRHALLTLLIAGAALLGSARPAEVPQAWVGAPETPALLFPESPAPWLPGRRPV